MSTGSDQRKFVPMVAALITWAYANGYELSFGDAFRDARVHGQMGEKKGYGHPSSYHKKRLAIDLNLFKDSKYLTETSDHEPLGLVWEAMGGTWGGRFDDGNHYSYGETR